jgi:DNA-binding GntR family transcriptional regulator
MLVETEALRQSIANGDEAWESQVVAAFYRLSKVEKRLMVDPAGASREFEERNREFHQALIAACPSRWLHYINGILYQQSERYRRIAVTRRNVPRDVHAEHQAILDATLARDVELACKLTAEHIERTLTVLRSVMAQAQPSMTASGEAPPAKAAAKTTKRKRITRAASKTQRARKADSVSAD